jgi:hypothetical protein
LNPDHITGPLGAKPWSFIDHVAPQILADGFGAVHGTIALPETGLFSYGNVAFLGPVPAIISQLVDLAIAFIQPG